MSIDDFIRSVNKNELAEKIAGYAKIRLCINVDGTYHPGDWLLSEKERITITRALRAGNRHAPAPTGDDRS